MSQFEDKVTMTKWIEKSTWKLSAHKVKTFLDQFKKLLGSFLPLALLANQLIFTEPLIITIIVMICLSRFFY